jgi:uncharacterized protein (DUF433 family)
VSFERITIDPEVMDGQPCLHGFRFPVVTVLRMVAGGMTVDENNAAEALAEHYYPLRSAT